MYFAARGQRKCLSDTQACKWTDFSATAGFGFRSNSGKNGTGRHTDVTEYMRPSASVTPRALFPTPAQMISIYLPSHPTPLPLPPPPSVSLAWMPNLGPVRAGRSLLKLRLLATRQPQCSVNHAFTNFKRKWGIHAVCWAARFDVFFLIIIYWALQMLRGQ